MKNARSSSSSSKPFRKCVLHIGTEKTGTTAIQHYLKNNRERLRRSGVYYPMAQDTDQTSQWEFVALCHHAPWLQDIGKELGVADAEGQQLFSNNLKQKLDREFTRHSDQDTLVISSEHLQSRLYFREEIERLKVFLEPWVERFEILVYFRRQDQLALSLLSTRLKSSARLEIDDIISTLNSTPKYYAYDEIFERWSDVFGIEAMRPKIYDRHQWPSQDLMADFSAAIGAPKLEVENTRYNRSLNRKGFHFIQALNSVYPNDIGDRSDTSRTALVSEVGRLFPGNFYPISREQAQEFFKQFKETNNRLKETAFPARQTPLFSDDFSEYPEEAEEISPDYRDAVLVAVELWKAKRKKAIPPLRRWWNLLFSRGSLNP